MAQERPRREAKIQKKIWLDAFADPLANLKSNSANICLADLFGDGDGKFLAADHSRKLRVYRGTTMISEKVLLEAPTAIATFYMDNTAKPPCNVAVATESFVFVYKVSGAVLRPFCKYTIPPLDVDENEKSIWADILNGKDVQKSIAALTDLKESGVMLTARSLDLLGLPDGSMNEVEAFLKGIDGAPLTQNNVITCMTTVKKDMDSALGVSKLVIGTESGLVLILNSTCTAAEVQVQLPSPPVKIIATGLFDVEYRVLAVCRSGKVYSIRDGELSSIILEVDTHPTDVALCGKRVYIGTMNSELHIFHLKGKKESTITLPDVPVEIHTLSLERARSFNGCLVALGNGEIRIYNGKYCVNKLDTGHGIRGICVGQFGREDSSLLIVQETGALVVKILQRRCDLDVATGHVGPPPEQDIPLNIPKKGEIFEEQVKRERDSAIEIHRTFQHDLCRLRLTTAKAYLKVVKDLQGPISGIADANVRLNAEVQGLGPHFRIKFAFENTGMTTLRGTTVTFDHDPNLYEIEKPQIMIPVLVPGILYNFSCSVMLKGEGLGSGQIRIYLCAAPPENSAPLVSAVVNMPVCESLFQQ